MASDVLASGGLVGVVVGALFSVGAAVGAAVAGSDADALAAFAACVGTRVFFLTGVFTRVGVCAIVGMRVRVGRGVRVGCGVSVGATRATLVGPRLRGVRVGTRVGVAVGAAGAHAAREYIAVQKIRTSQRGARKNFGCKFNVLCAETISGDKILMQD